MDDLIAFLRARWDEEEADARLAAEVYGKNWWWNPAFGLVKGTPDDDSEATSIFSLGEEDVAEVWSEVGPHIARHDPARVLHEVEAKRRILAELEGFIAGSEDLPNDERNADKATAFGIVRLLALPYADHEDYRQEWKP